MAMQEFYIRNESDTEARGPFTVEQLRSLIDSDQVTPATLYFDATTEEWKTVESDADLKGALFPEKRKLTVRAYPEREEVLNKKKPGAAPITVTDILAAAEGRTADTKGKQDPVDAMARAAGIGRWAAILALLLAAAGEMIPSADLIVAMDFGKIALNAVVILGALDLLLAVLLGLGTVSIYPFVRFRAALGLGFVGFLFWMQGQNFYVAVLGAACLGLYLCTALVDMLAVAIAAILGVGGFGFLAWQLLS